MSAPTVVDALHVLWIDDDRDDVDGLGDCLASMGHHVKVIDTVVEAESLLCTDGFDLLILDQKIGRDDQGGTSLIGRLKRHELGPANAGASFMFYTGSDEWVKNSDVDVRALPGFLDILEKGEVFEDWLDDNLHRVSAKSGGGTQSEYQTGSQIDARDSDGNRGERGASGQGEPVAGGGPVEEWDGVVIEVDSDSFRVRLRDLTGGAGEHEAKVVNSALTSAARSHLAIGARFYLKLTAEDDGDRRIVRSEATLSPVKILDQSVVASAFEEARRRRGES
jgi:CheY-like chemotaxis protein